MIGRLLSTGLGDVGLGFSAHGLRRLQLPGEDPRARLGGEGFSFDARAPAPARLEAWLGRLGAYFRGDEVGFDDLPVDLADATPFARSVYEAARRIPRGRTVTYGELAARLGTGASRAIGVALGRNPLAVVVPCHRVVGGDGCGGFSASGGLSTKAALLALEGGALDDESHRVSRRHLARVDRALAPLVKRVPCTLPVRPRGALFRTLVRAIAGQQLSVQAAATIFGRVEALLSASSSPEGGGAGWDARSPARLLAVSREALRGAGLSHAKVAAVRDLAERVACRRLDLDRLQRAPDALVIEELTRVRGIGRWTVEMVLVFDLGRPDVLPVADLGLRRGAQRVWGLRSLPDATTIERRAEPLRPFRSVASFYFWRALDAG